MKQLHQSATRYCANRRKTSLGRHWRKTTIAKVHRGATAFINRLTRQELENMGLRDSKHIARIIVDPVDSDVVYVAALGSLWARAANAGYSKRRMRIDVGECLKDRCGHWRD